MSSYSEGSAEAGEANGHWGPECIGWKQCESVGRFHLEAT